MTLYRNNKLVYTLYLLPTYAVLMSNLSRGIGASPLTGINGNGRKNLDLWVDLMFEKHSGLILGQYAEGPN
jgi:hypothetical protein